MTQLRGQQHDEIKELKAELAQLRMELAKERELSNALRLKFLGGQADVPFTPPSQEPDPIRYQVADLINDWVKARIHPVHGPAKEGAMKLVLLLTRIAR